VALSSGCRRDGGHPEDASPERRRKCNSGPNRAEGTSFSPTFSITRPAGLACQVSLGRLDGVGSNLDEQPLAQNRAPNVGGWGNEA